MFIPTVPLQSVLRLARALPSDRRATRLDERLAGVVGLDPADLGEAAYALSALGIARVARGAAKAVRATMPAMLAAVEAGELDGLSARLRNLASYQAFLALAERHAVVVAELPREGRLPFDTELTAEAFRVLLDYACLVGDAWVHGGRLRPGAARPTPRRMREALDRAFDAVSVDGSASFVDLLPSLCLDARMSPWAVQGALASLLSRGCGFRAVGTADPDRPAARMHVLGKAPWDGAGRVVSMDSLCLGGAAMSLIEAVPSGRRASLGSPPPWLQALPAMTVGASSAGGEPSVRPDGDGRIPRPREVGHVAPDREGRTAPRGPATDPSLAIPWGWQAVPGRGMVDECGRMRVALDGEGRHVTLRRYAISVTGPGGRPGIPLPSDRACAVLSDDGRPLAASRPHDAFSERARGRASAAMVEWLDASMPGWRDPVESWSARLPADLPEGIVAFPPRHARGVVGLPDDFDAAPLLALGFEPVPGHGAEGGLVAFRMPAGWSCNGAWTLVDRRGCKRTMSRDTQEWRLIRGLPWSLPVPGEGGPGLLPRYRLVRLFARHPYADQVDVGTGNARVAQVDGRHDRVLDASPEFAWKKPGELEANREAMASALAGRFPAFMDPRAYWSEVD